MEESIETLEKRAPHRPVREELTPTQIRYANLKVSTKLSNASIAKMLDIHVNTTTNWNKNPMVLAEMESQVDIVRKDNIIGMQRLMGSLIREAGDLLDDPEVGSTLKIQLIGQLFSQAGKFAGLEPTKKVEKKVNVVKSFEQMINCEAVDVDME